MALNSGFCLRLYSSSKEDNWEPPPPPSAVRAREASAAFKRTQPTASTHKSTESNTGYESTDGPSISEELQVPKQSYSTGLRTTNDVESVNPRQTKETTEVRTSVHQPVSTAVRSEVKVYLNYDSSGGGGDSSAQSEGESPGQNGDSVRSQHEEQPPSPVTNGVRVGESEERREELSEEARDREYAELEQALLVKPKPYIGLRTSPDRKSSQEERYARAQPFSYSMFDPAPPPTAKCEQETPSSDDGELSFEPYRSAKSHYAEKRHQVSSSVAPKRDLAETQAEHGGSVTPFKVQPKKSSPTRRSKADLSERGDARSQLYGRVNTKTEGGRDKYAIAGLGDRNDEHNATRVENRTLYSEKTRDSKWQSEGMTSKDVAKTSQTATQRLVKDKSDSRVTHNSVSFNRDVKTKKISEDSSNSRSPRSLDPGAHVFSRSNEKFKSRKDSAAINTRSRAFTDGTKLFQRRTGTFIPDDLDPPEDPLAFSTQSFKNAHSYSGAASENPGYDDIFDFDENEVGTRVEKEIPPGKEDFDKVKELYESREIFEADEAKARRNKKISDYGRISQGLVEKLQAHFDSKEYQARREMMTLRAMHDDLQRRHNSMRHWDETQISPFDEGFQFRTQYRYTVRESRSKRREKGLSMGSTPLDDDYIQRSLYRYTVRESRSLSRDLDRLSQTSGSTINVWEAGVSHRENRAPTQKKTPRNVKQADRYKRTDDSWSAARALARSEPELHQAGQSNPESERFSQYDELGPAVDERSRLADRYPSSGLSDSLLRSEGKGGNDAQVKNRWSLEEESGIYEVPEGHSGMHQRQIKSQTFGEQFSRRNEGVNRGINNWEDKISKEQQIKSASLTKNQAANHAISSEELRQSSQKNQLEKTGITSKNSSERHIIDFYSPDPYSKRAPEYRHVDTHLSKSAADSPDKDGNFAEDLKSSVKHEQHTKYQYFPKSGKTVKLEKDTGPIVDPADPGFLITTVQRTTEERLTHIESVESLNKLQVDESVIDHANRLAEFEEASRHRKATSSQEQLYLATTDGNVHKKKRYIQKGKAPVRYQSYDNLYEHQRTGSHMQERSRSLNELSIEHDDQVESPTQHQHHSSSSENVLHSEHRGRPRTRENLPRAPGAQTVREERHSVRESSSRTSLHQVSPMPAVPIPQTSQRVSSADPKRTRQQAGVSETKTGEVLFNFKAMTENELEVRKGDLVQVSRQIDHNWIEAELYGKRGIVPVSYIKILGQREQGEAGRASTLPAQSKPPVAAKETRARVKYNFEAQSAIELPLKKNDVVTIHKRIDDNWFEGSLGARRGIFPVTYVHVLTDNPDPGRAGTLPTPPGSSNTQGAQSVADGAQGGGGGGGEYLRALYGYEPLHPDELRLAPGDLVRVVERCDDGWFLGTSAASGLFGTFPGNYVSSQPLQQ